MSGAIRAVSDHILMPLRADLIPLALVDLCMIGAKQKRQSSTDRWILDEDQINHMQRGTVQYQHAPSQYHTCMFFIVQCCSTLVPSSLLRRLNFNFPSNFLSSASGSNHCVRACSNRYDIARVK